MKIPPGSPQPPPAQRTPRSPMFSIRTDAQESPFVRGGPSSVRVIRIVPVVALVVVSAGEADAAGPTLDDGAATHAAISIAAISRPRNRNRMGIAGTSECRQDGTDVRMVAWLLPDHRPEEPHHDEEPDEQRDQAEAAVGRVGALVGDELEPDPEDHGPDEEQEREDELRHWPRHR